MRSIEFIDKSLQSEVDRVGVLKEMKAGDILMSPGDVIENIPLVTKGSIRVLLQNSNGEEFYLYHILPGESCALSLSCCQANRRSEIKAVAEDDTEMIMVPVRFVDEWYRFPEWKKYISDIQALRFSNLLETVELVAFSKLDEQLWSYLIRKVQATGQRTLKITHQEIAQELNSPREVITRLLNQLQKQNKVVLSRGEIAVNSTL